MRLNEELQCLCCGELINEYFVKHIIYNCVWKLNINYNKYVLSNFPLDYKWNVNIDMVKRTILIHEMNLQYNYNNMNL